jgi:hypothetical protein
MTSNSQSASKLRRRLHNDCASEDLQRLRETLYELYEAESSPLGSQQEIATPAAFAALVEVNCLAHALAAAELGGNRAHIAKEMQQNVEKLYSGFHVDEVTMKGVRNAVNACKKSDTLDEAHHQTMLALEGTQLARRVRVARHSVSWPPSKRGRVASPRPSRFDDW